MIKKLDRYLLRHFFSSLLVVTVALGMTFIVINAIEQLRYFIDNNVPFFTIIEYYFYFAGWILKSFLPMYILLAILFSVSVLSRKNELLAMKASGISLYRITITFSLAILLISAAHFYYNEYIFPPWNKKRLEIKNFTIKNQSRKNFNRITDIYRQITPGHFYTMESFNVEQKTGRYLKVYKREENKLKYIITAKLLKYENFYWIAKEGNIRHFDDTLNESYVKFDTMTIVAIEDKPNDFAKLIGKPEDMGLDELRAYIDLMKRTGAPYTREAVDLDLKYSYPLTSFIVVLICIPIASNPRRGGIAASISVGALISLIYFVLFRIMQSAGYNEKVPHDVAVWGVNALFFLIGLITIIKTRK